MVCAGVAGGVTSITVGNSRKLPRKLLDLIRHCGRKEQVLPFTGYHFQDAVNLRHKTHIHHLIRLIQNQCLQQFGL